jgi:hypothetical protein
MPQLSLIQVLTRKNKAMPKHDVLSICPGAIHHTFIDHLGEQCHTIEAYGNFYFAKTESEAWQLCLDNLLKKVLTVLS